MPCNTACGACTGPSMFNCSECITPYILDTANTTCLLMCPDGSYKDD